MVACNSTHNIIHNVTYNIWHRRFLYLAQHISTWSKDPSTQVGAVIADRKRVVSVGYNGFPKGIRDDFRLENRDRKYSMILHAEDNALMFANRNIEGCTLYTYPFFPCSKCAARYIQCGISKVVSIEGKTPKRWVADVDLAFEMFYEARIDVVAVDIENTTTQHTRYNQHSGGDTMQLTCNAKELLSAIKIAGIVIDRKSILPILLDIQIKSEDDNTIYVTSMNSESAVTIAVNAEIKAGGAFSINPKKLCDILSNSSGSVSFDVVNGGELHIRCDTAKYKLFVRSDLYPPAMTVDEKDVVRGLHFQISGVNLSDVLNGAIYASPKGDAAYCVNGVLLDVEGSQLQAVATDGYRLGMSNKRHITRGSVSPESKHIAIVPNNAVKSLLKIVQCDKLYEGEKLDGDAVITVLVSDSRIQFEIGRSRVVSKLLEGSFPPYKEVIPKDALNVVFGGQKELISLFRRVSMFSGRDKQAVFVNIKGDVMEASCEDVESGSALDSIEIDNPSKVYIKIVMNIKYFMEAIKNSETDENGRVSIQMNDADFPCLVCAPERSDGDALGIVMPLEVDPRTSSATNRQHTCSVHPFDYLLAITV